MLASISIETQSPDGEGPVWYTLAQWAGGTIMVVLVVFLAVGVVQFVKGKANSNAESTRKGLTTAALSLGGAVILGTSAAAIAWSAQDSNYNIAGAGGDGAGTQGLANLMPSGARPAEVEVSRTGPLVTCEDTASIAAERHGRGGARSAHPTVAEHDVMESMLEDNDVRDQLVDTIIDQGTLGEGAMMIGTDEGFEQSFGSAETPAFRISRVEWIPSDSSGGCDASNREAVSDSNIEVTVWYGTGEGFFSDEAVEDWTVTVP